MSFRTVTELINHTGKDENTPFGGRGNEYPDSEAVDGFVTLGNLNDTVSRGSGKYFIYGDGGDGDSNGALGDKTIIRRNKTDILGLGNRNDYLIGANMRFWHN